MKRILIAAALLTASCSKQVNNPVVDTTTTFYRLQEVAKDGSVEFSPIRTATVDAATAGDNNPPNCPHHPLAIVVGSFSVVKQKDNTLKLQWQAVDESNIDHYTVERSYDSKTWSERGIVTPSGTGYYSYLDK